MKSEHRHELKTNELAKWLTNFPQWVRANLRMVIYISVVTVLVLGSYVYHRYQKNVVSTQGQLELTRLVNRLSQSKSQILKAQAQGLDASFTLLQIAENLRTVAKNVKDDNLAALALIKAAQALRMELHCRSEIVSKQDITSQINAAKADYTEALERVSQVNSLGPKSQNHPFNPSLMAMAEFGLGLCEEELSNFNKAKQIYSSITANTLLKGTTTVAQAKQRLNTMVDYQQQIAFKRLPEPAQAELTQPQIKLKEVDINLPGQ